MRRARGTLLGEMFGRGDQVVFGIWKLEPVFILGELFTSFLRSLQHDHMMSPCQTETKLLQDR